MQIHDWPQFEKEIERLDSEVTVFILSDRVPGQGQFLTTVEKVVYDPDSERSPSSGGQGAETLERLPKFQSLASKARLKRVGAHVRPFGLSTTASWWSARRCLCVCRWNVKKMSQNG